MSNIDAVNALLTAIHFDRFAEIEARHAPQATFHSFRGPTLHSSVAIADWHKEFLRDYADCNYTDIEYIEDGNTVAVRATLEAKADDWRPFSQRVVEVFEFDGVEVSARRLYGMMPDLELDKLATAAMGNATGYKGGTANQSRATVQAFCSAVLSGDFDGAKEQLDPKAVLIDSINGIAAGPDAIVEELRATPPPLFGSWRVTNLVASARNGLAELAIDPGRPRAANWLRIVDGKVVVIETYAMLREMGIDPFGGRRERHTRKVILPI